MKQKSTRGYGLLEGYLAKQRSRTADKLIPSYLRKGRILDIGCGTYPSFLKRIEFDEKYGLDKVVRDDQKKQFQNYNITLLNIDLDKDYLSHFDNEYFNIVTVLAVFEHIEQVNLRKLLKEIYRVLRPGGMYIMTTPAKWTDKLLRLLARLRLGSPVEIGEHKAAYDHNRISSLFQDAGFSKDKLKLGYFEVFMNIWTVGTK